MVSHSNPPVGVVRVYADEYVTQDIRCEEVHELAAPFGGL